MIVTSANRLYCYLGKGNDVIVNPYLKFCLKLKIKYSILLFNVYEKGEHL
jgi:hypothetical protein